MEKNITGPKDPRDSAFLDYLKKVEDLLKLWLEKIEDDSNRIRRPNDSE